MTSQGWLFSRQECRQAAEFARTFWWEIANFVWPRACLSRTNKEKPVYCCTPIIDGKKIFLRTLKCFSRRSWACTLKTPRASPWCKRASAELMGSPVWSLAEAASARWCWAWWLYQGRSSLPSQGKQQANQCPNAKCVVPKTAFSCRNIRSAETFSEFLRTSGKWTRKKQLAKINFVLLDIYIRCRKHAFNGCFEKWVQMDNLANHLKCDWARNSS